MLATREIHQAVENKVTSRLIGHVQVKGFAKAIEIHELIGPLDAAEASRPWREKFAEGLKYFRTRRFDLAADSFREVIHLRKQVEVSKSPQDTAPREDGPSRFYLNRIEELQTSPPLEDWIGEVSMKEK
jgi:hypothetical protein